jgi:flagellar motor switch protein FliG
MGLAAEEGRRVSDIAELSGTERAAVLIMYLEEKTARMLIEHIPADEIREIGFAMSALERVDSEVIEKVVHEFVLELTSAQLVSQRGHDFALNVLPRLVAPTHRRRLEGALRRRLSHDFEAFIATRPAAAVAAILTEEHPQTRAIALLMMGAENASKVMDCLEEDQRRDLLVRMARIDHVPSDLADEVEDAMCAALEDHGVERWSIDGISRTAKVVGRFDRDSQEDFFDDLAEESPGLSEEIRRKLVVFEDLSSMDDRSVQSLLTKIDREVLVIALRGAPPALSDMFLRNLSSRARQDVQDEISILGPMPRARVEEAREQIVQEVMALADAGTIPPLAGGGEELV